jgi:hypothetical protein
MFELKNKIFQIIRKFLEKNGIEPLYAITVLSWIIFLSYYNNFKKWNNIDNSTRRLTIAITYATLIISFFCFLKIFGIIDL